MSNFSVLDSFLILDAKDRSDSTQKVFEIQDLSLFNSQCKAIETVQILPVNSH